MKLKQLTHLEQMVDELENEYEEIENMAFFFDLPDNYDMQLLKIRDSINDLIAIAKERLAYETEHIDLVDLNALESTVR